ncbi:hypothetical protein [Spongiimicrobium sp. 3-5]|uniref:hypothetical protein n=1 Tax=Spongiimicrobium sp. 3-5 TaxID=3332596 RepID=UPI00397FF6B2
MFSKIGTYIKEGHRYAALEIQESVGEERYFFLGLEQKKGELHLANAIAPKTLDELKETLKKGTPLFLTINTTQVLTKITDTTGTSNPDAVVNHAFPNLDMDSFYYEVIQQSKSAVVSIAKKAYIDGVLERFNDLGISIFQFSLGISKFESLIPHLDESPVYFSNFKVDIADRQINEITPIINEEGHYSVNGLKVSNTNILGLASIVGHITSQTNASNFKDEIAALKNDYVNKRIFNLGLRTALGVLLTVLLINFFVFDHYYKKVATMNATLTASRANKERLSSLNTVVMEKRERMATLTSLSGSKTSYYLDELGKGVPTAILLKKIDYQPLTKPLRASKPVSLYKGTILVSGMCNDHEAFSEWVETLEKYDWIQQVETMDYDYVSKSASNFSIKIKLHEK